MGKPAPLKQTLKKLKNNKPRVEGLLQLAKRHKSVWKEIVRKRRHTIAHALAENAAFRAAAKKNKII